MAETAVNFVVEKLIPMLRNEVRVQRGLRAQVQGIRQDLETIQSFLRDADVQAEREDHTHNNTNMVKDWVRKVREVAHRIEDVIDEYRYQVAKRRQGKHGVAGLLRQVGGFVRSIKPSHEITSAIEDIRNTITTLKVRRETFESSLGGGGRGGSSSLGPITNSPWREYKLRSHFLNETQIVGIESPKKSLVASLLHHTPACKVIPIVGTGGLGKTTLVKQVYKHDKVTRTFQCRAWVEVTNSFKVEEVLKKLIRHFQKNTDFGMEVDQQQLIKEARECLQGKRYLIVFDDVWAEDFWTKIAVALPPNDKGSRIIITTRNQKVANNCRGSTEVEVKPFPLKPLQHREALKLFYQNAFHGGECPDELKGLSFEIVKKCGRIPLAIVAIGSLLSNKNNQVSEWKKVHDNLGSNLDNDVDLKGFNAVMSESYHDLPYSLKLCFLYFGIFPEDYAIGCKRLVRLWIAEGFVEGSAEENPDSLEEVGMEYLLELISRSLVQVAWVDFDGKARSCKVHDMMHEFIRKKCKELNFCQVLSEKGFSLISSLPPRRLSIHESNNENNWVPEASSNFAVRSFFVFSMQGLPKSLIFTFKLLRTLDLDESPLDALPEQVGQLLLLRYLSVRNTRTRILPKSIGKLHNLLTLDVKNSKIHELPEEINKLINLRHLLGYSFHEDINLSMGSYQGLKIKEGFGHLKFLQKLYSIDMSHQGTASIIKEFRKLRYLKKLGITKLRRQNGRALCAAIETLTCLYSLSIGSVDENEFLDLESLTHPPENLQRLYLEGRLKRLPEWVSKLKNLVRLHLNWSGLIDDPITAINDLPELLELGLREAYEGDDLCFKEEWLKKLKILRLRGLKRLKTLKIYEGALPQLEKLYVGPCPQMAEVPNDIRNLKTLQTLRFYDMSTGFTQSMDPTQQNHFKIQHVPSVLFFNKQGSGNRYISNSLHYTDIMKNKYGSDDYEIGPLLELQEANEESFPIEMIRQHGNIGTTDKWFWVTALLLSVLVVIHAILSRFLEHASFRIY